MYHATKVMHVKDMPPKWTARVLFLSKSDGVVEAYAPLIAYMAFHRFRSRTWQDSVSRGVGLLWDFMQAHADSNMGPDEAPWRRKTFNAFAHSLLSGTVNDGCDPLKLYWPGMPKARVLVLLRAVEDFLEWFHFEWRKETGREDVIGDPVRPKDSLSFSDLLIWSRVRKFSMLEDLRLPKHIRRMPEYDLGRTDSSAVEPVKFFPPSHSTKLVEEGHRRPTKRGMRPWNIRDQMVALLCQFGGLRRSEAFHIYETDVTLDPARPGCALVVLHHPSEAKITFDDAFGLRVTVKRAEYLRQIYDLAPRHWVTRGNCHAGWKGMLLSKKKRTIVHWLDDGAGKLFYELYKAYESDRRKIMALRKMAGGWNHPFLFVSEGPSRQADRAEVIGDPYSMKAYTRNHRAAVKRLCLPYGKDHGTTTHGLRHAYGRALMDLELAAPVIQRALHHGHPHSQIVYTARDDGKTSEALCTATRKKGVRTNFSLPGSESSRALHEHIEPRSHRVSDCKNVIDLAHMSGGEWYNLDFTRFALNPRAFHASSHGEHGRADDGTPSDDAKRVLEFSGHLDGLVTGYAHADGLVRKRIAAELVDLHERGMILWPLTVMFDRSVLGPFGTRRIGAAICDALPHLVSIRMCLEAAEVTKPLTPRRQAVCRAMWELVVGMRFSSTAGIESLEDFDDQHFQVLVDTLKPGGPYRPDVPGLIMEAMKGLTSFYAKDPSRPDLVVPKRIPSVTRKTKPDPVERREGHLDWVVADWERWRIAMHMMGGYTYHQALSLLVQHLSTLPKEACSDAAAALSRKNMLGLLDFARSWSVPRTQFGALSKIRRFCEWLSADSMGDGNQPKTPVTLFHQDVTRFMTKNAGAESTQGTRDSTRPMPLEFHEMLKEIVTGNDFEWPRSLRDRKTNALAQYFTRRGPTGMTEQVFCPVLSRMLLLHLDLPLRNVQVRRLDSGEGDERRWDAEGNTWGPNTGPHAGHWRRTRAKNAKRGVFREMKTHSGNTLTGLWINSNKTQDRITLFDERSGYAMPWQHEGALKNLDFIRRWNEDNNPVDGPMPYAALNPGTFVGDPTPSVRVRIPDRFYLFRSPLNPGPRGREQPPTYEIFDAFFGAALEELERRWNDDNPDRPVEIVEERDGYGVPKTLRFTIHGMRAATLTGLHQAGVPIGIISKLIAGHASILMTFKYLNYDPAHVSEIINAARVAADANRQSEFERFLKSAEFEDAVRKTATVNDEQPASRGGKIDLSICSRLDIGICPNGATKCSSGGPQVGDKRFDVHIEVPGGPRNCIRCRYFLTGLPFLIPLWMHGNSLLAKADGFARQAKEQDDEIVRLKALKARLRAKMQPVPSHLSDRIRTLVEAYRNVCARRDLASGDFHVCQEVVDKVRALGMERAADPSDPNLPAPTPAEVPTIEGRPSSRYEVTDAVVHAGRFYPSMECADVERERDGMTVGIFINNGFVPTWTTLGKAERQRSADALARLFLGELGAAEVDRLIDGSKLLADHRGLEERFRRVCRETTGKGPVRIGQRKPPLSIDVEPEKE